MKASLYFNTSLQASCWVILWAFVKASFIGSTSHSQILGLPSTRSQFLLQSSQQEYESMGLSDDGDFLIYGINADDPVSNTDSSESPEKSLTPGVAEQSLSFFGINSNKESSPSPVATTASPPVPTAEDTIFIDQERIKSVESWLMATIPSLHSNDCKAYARELVTIGFDPECITQCELRFDDLHFMKLLHRRYVYNEVTGQGHPWKP